MLNKICPRCGASNQMYLEYNHGWEAECLQCSAIVPVNGIPADLNPAKFTSVGIQSPNQVHTNYKIPFGGTNINHLFGRKGSGE
jgi:hypothetical protein